MQKYSVNPLFKLDNLDYFFDLKNTFTNKGFLNYSFNPVKEYVYNHTTFEKDSDGNNISLFFDLDEEYRYQFVNQYLYEYQNYFKSLDEEFAARENTEEELAYLEQTKYSLYFKSNIINSFVKGTHIGIETILGLFCKNLRYNIYYVEVSPFDRNFVYRITTDLPILYWNNVIKDIVHPVSWKYEYVEINQWDSSFTNIWLANKSLHNFSFINYRDDYQRRVELLNQSIVPISYLTTESRLPYNTLTDTYEISSVGNFETPFKFSNYQSKYNVDIDLTDVGSDPRIGEHSFSVVEENGFKKVHFEYLFTGIFTNYTFWVYDGATLLFTFNTEYNFIDFSVLSTITELSVIVGSQSVNIDNTLMLVDETGELTIDDGTQLITDDVRDFVLESLSINTDNKQQVIIDDITYWVLIPSITLTI